MMVFFKNKYPLFIICESDVTWEATLFQVLKGHLPPKVECVLFCRPCRRQVRTYRSVLDSSAVRSLFADGVASRDHLVFIQAMRRLCNHPSLYLASEDDESQVLFVFFCFFFDNSKSFPMIRNRLVKGPLSEVILKTRSI